MVGAFVEFDPTVANVHMAETQLAEQTIEPREDFTAVLLATPDILFVILSRLDPTSRVCVSLTNRAWRAAILQQREKHGLGVAFRARDFVMSPILLDWGRNYFGFGGVPLTRLATEEGQLQTLCYLEQKGLLDLDYKLCWEAACRGNVEILAWAKRNPFLWTCWGDEGASVCAYAAKGGHFEALQWLQTHGCKWDAWVCYNAVKTGNLQLLRWVREKGCPWDGKVCLLAARHGKLEILRWSRENGCPWNSQKCLSSAVIGGHVDVAEWIRAQRNLKP